MLLAELGLEMDEEMLLSEEIDDDPSNNSKTCLVYIVQLKSMYVCPR